MVKRKTMLVTILLIVTTLLFNGCQLGKTKAINTPLVPALSEKEVIDYYRESLNYDNVVSRNIAKSGEHETREVGSSMKAILGQAQQKAEAELGSHTYGGDFMVSEDVHAYIKATFDDKVLTRKGVAGQSAYMEYYFIDVEYDMAPQATGSLGGNAKYLGIHGAFKDDRMGSIRPDVAFINSINGKVNNYMSQLKGNNAVYRGDPGQGQSGGQEQLEEPEDTWESLEELSEESWEAGGGEHEEEQVEETPEVPEPVPAVGGKTVVNPRYPQLDIGIYNKVVGGSITQAAVMPKLDSVYHSAAPRGSISGYGIYPQGRYGMSVFGFNRDTMKGKATLRYVFRSNLMDSNELIFVNVFPTNIEVDNKLEGEPTIVPMFVEEEIKKVVERSDRSIANNDLAGLMSGNIHSDLGVAILNGFYQNHTYLMRIISDVKGIVGRSGNYYMADVETIVQDVVKGGEGHALYRDTARVIIKQEGLAFVINDHLVIKRELVKEPELKLDSSIDKRLAALGFRGEIDSKSKSAIGELLNTLYAESTGRSLKGMYNCFNDDVNLLSSSKKEYLNAQLREWLVKHGVETETVYGGQIIEWIGGANNQAELITEELIDYKGKDVGQYMQVYYLVSGLNEQWVIDEMKIIEVSNVSGNELDSIRSRVHK